MIRTDTTPIRASRYILAPSLVSVLLIAHPLFAYANPLNIEAAAVGYLNLSTFVIASLKYALPMALAVELPTMAMYLFAFNLPTKRRIIVVHGLIQLISVPILYVVLYDIVQDSTTHSVLISIATALELFIVLIEGSINRLINHTTYSLGHALQASLCANVASFLVGLLAHGSLIWW